MTVNELIEHLKTFSPDAEVNFPKKVIKDRNGFNVAEYEYVPLESKYVYTTRFGGNNVFIGEK